MPNRSLGRSKSIHAGFLLNFFWTSLNDSVFSSPAGVSSGSEITLQQTKDDSYLDVFE